MTEINKLIEKTERLLAAATQGSCPLVIRNDGSGDFADYEHLSDANLFAAAPAALRALVDEVKRLRQQVAQLEFDATTQPNADWQPNSKNAGPRYRSPAAYEGNAGDSDADPV